MGCTMEDESKLTDAILAAYNEEHANFMKSFMIVTELVPDLIDEELVEYTGSGRKSTRTMLSKKGSSGG